MVKIPKCISIRTTYDDCRGLKDHFSYVGSVNIEMFENTESVMLCSFLEAQRSTKIRLNNDKLVAFSSQTTNLLSV